MTQPSTAPHTGQTIAEVTALFQQPWWLDAVAPGTWSAVEINNGSGLVARLPYTLRKRFGLTLLTMPPLTQSLGPWLSPASGKPETVLTRQHHLLGRLADALPRFDLFHQHFHSTLANWLPFYWRGFVQTTRYTYTLDLTQPIDVLWQGLRDKTRTAVRHAERSGIVVEVSEDIDAFLTLHALTYSRQGLAPMVSAELICRLFQAARQRACGRLFLARGRDGRVHSGLYCVFDERACYYLLQGADPQLRASGANCLCVWESIKYAATVSPVYDFEGSMRQSIEHFVRSFGARQVPYFSVRGYSRRMRVVQSVRDMARALTGQAGAANNRLS